MRTTRRSTRCSPPGDTDGVFQLESAGMRQVLIAALSPENLEDIIAVISLYRPGPMESIPRYIAGKHDPGSVTLCHAAACEPILDVTYGCMVYQEQVMQIVRDLAGYSLGRSDMVRRAMAKKKKEVMDKEKKVFVDGAVDEDGQRRRSRRGAPGHERGGGRCRSSTEMAAVRAATPSTRATPRPMRWSPLQTAYLKCHYPVEFLAAILNSRRGQLEQDRRLHPVLGARRASRSCRRTSTARRGSSPSRAAASATA